MEESLAEKYIKIISEATPESRGVELTAFFSAVFSSDLYTSKNIIMMRKLNKIYGWKIVFMAILDMADIDNLNIANPYPLLVFLCKKSLLKQEDKVTFPDLTSSVDSIIKKLDKRTK